jgi:hypothetical protein
MAHNSRCIKREQVINDGLKIFLIWPDSQKKSTLNYIRNTSVQTNSGITVNTRNSPGPREVNISTINLKGQYRIVKS